jgi:hypothetical protein
MHEDRFVGQASHRQIVSSRTKKKEKKKYSNKKRLLEATRWRERPNAKRFFLYSCLPQDGLVYIYSKASIHSSINI